MIGGGLLLVGSAISRAYKEAIQEYKGKSTGTVIEIVAGPPDEIGAAAGIHDYYYPVIAYYAAGIFYKERYKVGGNPCPLKLNQKMEIRYNLKNQTQFTLAETTGHDVLYKCLHYSGILCFIGGGVLYLLFSMGAV